MAKPDPTISLGFLNYSLRALLPKCARPQKLQSTKNTAVVGAYVESAVRQLVRRQVHPLHVATGAVIDQANIPGDPRLPQLDTSATVSFRPKALSPNQIPHFQTDSVRVRWTSNGSSRWQ